MRKLNVLNLYAGLGGNRKLWTGCDVTAVELDPRIAAVYARLYPQDKVIVADAHGYLLDHMGYFDFIWSSPPCQTHSRLARVNSRKKPGYVNMALWQEIIHLQQFFKGEWIVENVVPFYQPLFRPMVLGRHAYWASFDVGCYVEPRPAGLANVAQAGKQAYMDWLGIHFPETIYYGTNQCPVQVLRNCVHPNEGLAIFDRAFGGIKI